MTKTIKEQIETSDWENINLEQRFLSKNRAVSRKQQKQAKNNFSHISFLSESEINNLKNLGIYL